MKTFDDAAKYYNKFVTITHLNSSKKTADNLNIEKHFNILDVGGGTGNLIPYLADKCKTYHIIDLSKKMLSYSQKKSNVVIFNEDFLKFNKYLSFYDVIVMSDFLHHIKNQSDAVKNAFRLLKNNGKIVIYDFDIKKIFAKMLNLFEKIVFKDVYFMKESYCLTLLEKNGFEIEKIVRDKIGYLVIGIKNDE